MDDAGRENGVGGDGDGDGRRQKKKRYASEIAVLRFDCYFFFVYVSWNVQGTMVENKKKHRQNSHPIIHCLMSEEVSERGNE